MLYYFWRTTGSPFRTPYTVYSQAYEPVPLFPWQKVSVSPVYRNSVMQKFYLGEMLENYQSSRHSPFIFGVLRMIFWWAFFLGPVLTLPLLMLAVVWRHGPFGADVARKVLFLVVVCAISFLALLMPIYYAPHYAAPMTSAIYALFVLAMLQVRHWKWRGRAAGLFVVRAVPVACGILLLLRVAAGPLRIPLTSRHWPSWCMQGDQLPERARLLAQMNGYERKELLLVRYQPEHDPHSEWVYNSADIDGSKVVWARDMGPAKNEELLDYFRGRQVWLVEPDQTPARVTVYPEQGPATASQ
jgi:hypothetical protein